MSSYSCRLCGAPILSKHAVAIFSLTAAKQRRLSTRIKDLLDIEVGLDNGLSQHICQRCKRRLETLERAAEDLRDFHSQARRNYQRLLAAHRGSLKRPKETSASVGVSPDTQKSRPAPKRQTARRHLHFALGKYTRLVKRFICTYNVKRVTCTMSKLWQRFITGDEWGAKLSVFAICSADISTVFTTPTDSDRAIASTRMCEKWVIDITWSLVKNEIFIQYKAVDRVPDQPSMTTTDKETVEVHVHVCIPVLQL